MVRIIWQDIALEQLKKHLEYSATEFGIKTMNKFIKEVEYFEERLKMMPESYTPVQELKDRKHIYRGCIIMRNFKLIHFYDSEQDTVFVDYIWDTRMNPVKLVRLYKNK